MFGGIDVSIYGLPPQERSRLSDAIKSHGGLVHYVPSPKTTHLVVTEDFIKANPVRTEEAQKKGHRLVSAQFFSESIDKGQRLDDLPFLFAVGKKTSDAVENGDIRSEASLSEDAVTATQVEDTKPAQPNPKTQVAAFTPPKSKDAKWRSARVFISSTFRDMHGERDYLTRNVFPELQERCNKLRVHVTPVDLRWGVTEEETQQALEICLGEIDNCRPFFIGLLGRRYGWCPDQYIVPDEPRYDWLKYFPTGCSITHLEMHYGVLRDPSTARGFFYMRDPSFERDVPSAELKNFEAESFSSSQKMEKLKEEIKERMPPKCVYDYYPCSWKGVVDGKPMVGDLESFGDRVLNDLWEAFCEEFVEEEVEVDALTQARSYHESFIETHSRGFVGRTKILDKLHQYVAADAKNTCVVVGEPGGGKSSLVSAFARDYLQKSKATGDFVVCHFVGAAPGSTDIRHTLDRLCNELKLILANCPLVEESAADKADEAGDDKAKDKDKEDEDEDVEKEEGVAADFTSLKYNFIRLLDKASAAVSSSKKRLVLIIDALNQLDDSYNAHSLDWLPKEPPKGLRLIVSTLAGPCLESLKRREHQEVLVGPLDLDERKEIVRKTLWEYRKKLDDKQMKQLLAKKDAHKPLYLIVACEELRVFGVYEMVTERIAKMAHTVPELFEEVLKRLENDNGWELVRNALSLLKCSRGGLLESEMIYLLSSDIKPNKVDMCEEAFMENLRNGRGSIPSSVWSRLYRALKPYLRPAGDSGEGVLDFFHQQLMFAVDRRYLHNTSEPNLGVSIHARLATYFRYLADPDGDSSWRSYHRRGTSEAPYHQMEAHLWKALESTLCDIAFIETKCSMGMTYDLVADYLNVAKILPQHQGSVPDDIQKKLAEFHRFVQARAYILASRPEQTFAQAANMPSTSGPASKATARWYEGKEARPWAKWNNKPSIANPCIMTLTGHTMVVRKCESCPIPGSNRLISASDDMTLKIYDSRTGAELSTLSGHTASVQCASYSPDGKTIVSSSWNKQIKVWNAETGAELATITGNKGVVTQVAFSPDGQHIASSSMDKTVRVYCARSYAELACLKGHEEGVNGVAWSRDGASVASASADKKAIIWDWRSASQSHTLHGHTGPVLKIAYSPDGQSLVTASDDRTARIWSTSGSNIGTLTGHKDGVVAANFSHDGKMIVTASHDNMIILWSTEAPHPQLAILLGHTGTVFDCSFTPGDESIISASFDRTVKLWACDPAWLPKADPDEKGPRGRPPRGRKPVSFVTGHSARILGCAYSPDGRLVATASRDKTLKIWNANTGVEMASLVGHKSNVFACAWSPDSQRVVSASRDSTLKVWNAQTGECVGTLEGHTGVVLDCCWSPDGTTIVSASADKTVRLWNSTTFAQAAVMYGHRASVTCCAYSPDGRRIVSGAEDKTLKLWDARRHSKVATFCGHLKTVKTCAFSPDSRRVVSGGDDKLLIEWSAVNAKKLAVWTKHKAQITDVAYTKNGLFVISGSTDNNIIMWTSQSKEEACSFTCLSRITALSTSPEGLSFAVGDGSGTFYIFTPVGLTSVVEDKDAVKPQEETKQQQLPVATSKTVLT